MSVYLDRASARDALLAPVPDLDAVFDALRQFAPLPSGPSVQLDRAVLRRTLDAFIQGVLSPVALERWAEAVHTAEDISLDSSDRDFLSEALFELSTPEIFGSMEEIVARFRARDTGPRGGG